MIERLGLDEIENVPSRPLPDPPATRGCAEVERSTSATARRTWLATHVERGRATEAAA